ncbi:MAG: signal recognition particle-docking protein FtsY [Clostridiales bacterium]|nr:signal recognition particle-docking protein FtsY [Clostridiales bacterium]
MGFFQKIKNGLAKTRQNIIGNVENVLAAFTKIDDDLFEELEEALIMADVGVTTSGKIITLVKNRVKHERVTDVSEIKTILAGEITKILTEGEPEAFNHPYPAVFLIIGVNGAGKTTSIGKLTSFYKSKGKKVLLAAGDTFRAAAIDQLEVWAKRNAVEMIKHAENSDPAAVVFDAVNAAKARAADVLICDTAGRLHNKKNLMEELKKINRVIEREYPEACFEVFLVLDATTGQNALRQAQLFKETANITGIILTKLDSTAKGGIVIAVKDELGIPVRFVGVGEGLDDMREFSAADFAKALFFEEGN